MSVGPAKVERIWYMDLVGFVDVGNLIKFIPDKSMTFEEQLNAAFRFSILFSVLVFVIRHDYRVFFFAIFVGIVTAIMYTAKQQQANARAEQFDNLNVRYFPRTRKACYKPSRNNPYMNVSLLDYQDFPNRPQACNVSNKQVKKEIKAFYDESLPRDADDVFHTKASDRQFFTNPSTTIPNDQEGFAKWLFQTGKTCKEDSISCRTPY